MANQEAREPARRGFLQTAGVVAGVALGLHACASGAAAQPEKLADPTRPPPAGGDAIPRRPFGNKDVRVSALGLGGHHLGEVQTVEQAIALVHEAIDAGITFFDNC